MSILVIMKCVLGVREKLYDDRSVLETKSS